MKKIKLILGILIIGLLVSSYADNEFVLNCVTGQTYGFWGGLGGSSSTAVKK